MQIKLLSMKLCSIKAKLIDEWSVKLSMDDKLIANVGTDTFLSSIFRIHSQTATWNDATS